MEQNSIWSVGQIPTGKAQHFNRSEEKKKSSFMCFGLMLLPLAACVIQRDMPEDDTVLLFLLIYISNGFIYVQKRLYFTLPPPPNSPSQFENTLLLKVSADSLGTPCY